MKKENEDIPGVIPENEFKPELEKQVEYYYALAPKPDFISKKKYSPNRYPERFSSPQEELEYQVEEIRRLRQGYDGLCGKGYGFLHYAVLRGPDGKRQPQFRAAQEQYFKKIESIQEHPGRGLVGYKRRRVGYTWMEAWDALHDSITTPFNQIGMNSKTESDSWMMFRHVKFLYQSLPDWLRPRASAADRRDYLEFGWNDKDASGNRIKRGLQSWILAVPPTDTGHEGKAYKKLIIDEAGKISNLLTIWKHAEDCLNDNTRRVGVPIIMGTVGDIDKDGKGLMELYLNNEAYNLDRFCFHGYNGLIIDEFGNDMVKEAIRWIIYERDKKKNTSKAYQKAFIQKYPLNENDAFYYVSEGGVGNMDLINEQEIRITANPPERRTGWMRKRPNSGVDFVPHPEGKVIIYEVPEQITNGYVAGADPSDHDDLKASRDVSNLALAVIKKPFSFDAPKLVVEYVDRPEKLDVFFEQTAMILQWYNNTKVLIEDNRARMVNYFKANYPNLLPLVPKGIATAKVGVEMKYSVKMTEERKQQMMGLIEDNVDNYCSYIPSIRLLNEFKVFGDPHKFDDFAIAYGWALIMLQADRKAAKATSETQAPLLRHYTLQGSRIVVNLPPNQNNKKSGIAHPIYG